MFRKIDDWLFDKVFQPFADWFCDLSGRNPFWLAATCMYIWITVVIYDNVTFQNSWISMAVDGFLVIVFGLTAISYDRNSAAPQAMNVSLNPYRTNNFFVFLRMFCVLNYPLMVLGIFMYQKGQGETHSPGLNLLRSTMFLLYLYFEACETKPPAPPKEKMERKLAYAK